MPPSSPPVSLLPADLEQALRAEGWEGDPPAHTSASRHCPLLVWVVRRPASASWSDQQTLAAVRGLIQSGADPRSTWRGMCALAQACWQRTGLAQALLDMGVGLPASPHVLRRACYTPACPVSVVEALLDAGAQPDAPDEDGWSPFLVACGSRPDVLPLMLRRGAQVNQCVDTGWTPLMAACHQQPGAVPLLLEAGARLQVQDRDGRTPLTVACEHHPVLIPVLVAAGANLEAPGPAGDTALVVAAKMGWADALQRLLEAGASLEPLNRQPDLRKILDPTVRPVLAAWDTQMALLAQTPLCTKAIPSPRPRM